MGALSTLASQKDSHPWVLLDPQAPDWRVCYFDFIESMSTITVAHILPRKRYWNIKIELFIVTVLKISVKLIYCVKNNDVPRFFNLIKVSCLVLWRIPEFLDKKKTTELLQRNWQTFLHKDLSKWDSNLKWGEEMWFVTQYFRLLCQWGPQNIVQTNIMTLYMILYNMKIKLS